MNAKISKRRAFCQSDTLRKSFQNTHTHVRPQTKQIAENINDFGFVMLVVADPRCATSLGERCLENVGSIETRKFIYFVFVDSRGQAVEGWPRLKALNFANLGAPLGTSNSNEVV